MDAVVLCGGAGTRVQEVTNNEIPKILIPIKGVPFIDYMIDALLMACINTIYFAAGYHGDQIEDYIKNKLSYAQRRYGQFEVIVEQHPRGTGGALKGIMGFYWKKKSHILVVNGDTVVYGPKFPFIMHEMSLWEWADGSKKDYRTLSIAYAQLGESDGSLGLFNCGRRAGWPYKPLSIRGERGGNAYNRVYTFEEKAKGRGFINLGWYILSANLFSDVIDWEDNCSLEGHLMPKWLEDNEFYHLDFHGEPHRILDIGTTERINMINSTK
jgi:NDP-sugar pyrophosphorylase family protein